MLRNKDLLEYSIDLRSQNNFYQFSANREKVSSMQNLSLRKFKANGQLEQLLITQIKDNRTSNPTK